MPTSSAARPNARSERPVYARLPSPRVTRPASGLKSPARLGLKRRRCRHSRIRPVRRCGSGGACACPRVETWKCRSKSIDRLDKAHAGCFRPRGARSSNYRKPPPRIAGKYPTAATAPLRSMSIERATAAVDRRIAASALVTNPIAKNVLYEAGFKHPGHTEFLALPGRPRISRQSVTVR